MLFRIVRGYLASKCTIGAGCKDRRHWSWHLVSEGEKRDRSITDLKFPVTVDAIDISMAQCPPKSWLTKNIRLIAHDVQQPFPRSMLGTYDFVNVHNWLCFGKEEKSETLIRNLLGLLSECLGLPP